MAGLVPAIHVFDWRSTCLAERDARNKSGHDERIYRARESAQLTHGADTAADGGGRGQCRLSVGSSDNDGNGPLPETRTLSMDTSAGCRDGGWHHRQSDGVPSLFALASIIHPDTGKRTLRVASVSITKLSAAQRQIDAAIRIMFSGEDILAVHTIVAAAHTVVVDLAKKRNMTPYTQSIAKTITTLFRQNSGEEIPNNKLQRWTTQLENKYYRHLKRPANFLKHADTDPGSVLDQDNLQTDSLLLASCIIYAKLGLDYTPEMKAFIRWHLAVYPGEDGDEIKTDSGYVHDLSRDHQLDCGEILLSFYRESSELSP